MKNKIIVRQATLDDLEEILLVEEEAWPQEARATEEMFRARIETFPEGTLVAIENGRIMGVVVTEIIKFDIKQPIPTWFEATDNGYIRKSHDPKGDTLYGVNLSVSRYAGREVARLLLEGVKKIARDHSLKRVAFGARIPRYHRYSEKMTAEEYIQATTNSGRPLDPEIYFYQQGSAEVIKLLPDYFTDPESLNYGVLMIWENPDYHL